MRTIKFRAWDIFNKKMLGPKTLEELSNGSLMWFENLEKMQFTGLLDKNGKEIYEGDILKWTQLGTDFEEKYTCEWLGFKYVLKIIGWHGEPIPDDLDSTEDLEVIGNIHSYPELLK